MTTDFEEYIRQSEPHKGEKGYVWQTAIGLLRVSADIQSAKASISKCNICTLNCTLEKNSQTNN